jgi:GNAT superfamily N-acetyltransferase
MELWAEYIEERENAHVIYNDHGFITYKNESDTEVLICDFYVKPRYRKSGVADDLYKQMLSLEKPKIVYATSDRDSKNWEAAHGFITHYGFKEVEELTDGSLVYYRREF